MRRRLSVDDEEESSDRRALCIRRRLSETETLPCTAVSQIEPIVNVRQSNVSNIETPARFALPQSQPLIENEGRFVQSNLTADENMHPTSNSQLVSLLQADLRLSSLMPTTMSVREMEPGFARSDIQHNIEENRPSLSTFNLVDHAVTSSRNELSQTQTMIETVAGSNTPDLICTEEMPPRSEPLLIIVTQASEISNLIQNGTTPPQSDIVHAIFNFEIPIDQIIAEALAEDELQLPALCPSVTSYVETPPRYTLSKMQASPEPGLAFLHPQGSLRPNLEITPSIISTNILSVTQPESNLSTSTPSVTPEQIPISSVNPSSATPSTSNTIVTMQPESSLSTSTPSVTGNETTEQILVSSVIVEDPSSDAPSSSYTDDPENDPAHREYWLAREVDLFADYSLVESGNAEVAVSDSTGVAVSDSAGVAVSDSAAVSRSSSESNSDTDADVIVRQMNTVDQNLLDTDSDDSFTFTNNDLYIYGVRPVDVIFFISSDDSN